MTSGRETTLSSASGVSSIESTLERQETGDTRHRPSVMTTSSHDLEMKEIKEELDKKEEEYKRQIEELNKKIKDKNNEVQSVQYQIDEGEEKMTSSGFSYSHLDDLSREQLIVKDSKIKQLTEKLNNIKLKYGSVQRHQTQSVSQET